MTGANARNYNKAMQNYILITTDEQLRKTAQLASSIWRECYKGILSPSQIEYMVANYQSYDSMKNDINRGALYYAVEEDGTQTGYVALEKQKDSLYLSKLYLSQSVRGKGKGSESLSFVKSKAREFGYNAVTLHVNKYNERAIKAYTANGFRVTQPLDTPLGEGFVMEDYVMRCDL